MTINDNESFKYNYVLSADILGFSNLTSNHEQKADLILRKFHKIIDSCFKESDETKIFYRVISDQVVVGFKDLGEAINHSRQIFHKCFCEKIPLRGTIGIGDFTYRPDKNNNKMDFTIGEGLALSTFADKQHLKGHTLILVCKNDTTFPYAVHALSSFKLKGLSKELKELKTYIVCWWENSESEDLKKDIDTRINGLDCKTIEYLEKTKENMNSFKNREDRSLFNGC